MVDATLCYFLDDYTNVLGLLPIIHKYHVFPYFKLSPLTSKPNIIQAYNSQFDNDREYNITLQHFGA